MTAGGYEYNLALIGAMAALTEAGPGRPSVDAALAPRLRGSGWAIAALAAAAAGSWLATDRFTEPEQPSFEREPRFRREEAPVGAV